MKRKLRPDISISFLEGADYINILSRHGEKIVCSIRGSKKYDQNIRGAGRWLRERLIWPYIYRQANAIVAVNHGIAQEMHSYLDPKAAGRINVITHQPDNSQVHQLAGEPLPEPYRQLFSGRKMIVSVGRLAQEKGFHLFLPLFKRIQQQVSEAGYLIVGAGEWQQQLIQECDRLGLSYSLPEDYRPDKQVYFAGYDKNPVRFIAAASLFVLPSVHEGYPNALLEALHTAAAIVAADCPYGPREIIAGIADYSAPLDYPFNKQNTTLLPNLSKAGKSRHTLWESTITELLNQQNQPPTPWEPPAHTGYSWNKLIEEL